MKDLERRIEDLEEIDGGFTPTILICSDGSEFKLPMEGPESRVQGYVLRHGRRTPDGREIVDLKMDPLEDADELSLAVEEYERDIARGVIDIKAEIEKLEALRGHGNTIG